MPGSPRTLPCTDVYKRQVLAPTEVVVQTLECPFQSGYLPKQLDVYKRQTDYQIANNRHARAITKELLVCRLCIILLCLYELMVEIRCV